jgi:hypothetical protein
MRTKGNARQSMADESSGGSRKSLADAVVDADDRDGDK